MFLQGVAVGFVIGGIAVPAFIYWLFDSISSQRYPEPKGVSISTRPSTDVYDEEKYSAADKSKDDLRYSAADANKTID